MFESAESRLYAPLHLPAALNSRLVLGAIDLQISGGDALQASDDFEKIPQDIRSIYWARHKQGGRRLVIAEIARGWRGDTYSVHLLDGQATPAAFLQSPMAAPVIEHAWRPPPVFRSIASDALWLIDVGQPFEICPDWRVFVMPEMQALCLVHFCDSSSDPARSLPDALRALLPVLDAAIGQGLDEGTLQPTARLRLHVQHVLANAALRPWAVSGGDVSDSRATVDAGLEVWARQAPEQAEMHAALRAGERDAEQALADHYATHFALQPDEARRIAAWMLDIVIRAHFVFPRGGGEQAPEQPSPWPQGAKRNLRRCERVRRIWLRRRICPARRSLPVCREL